MKKLLPLFIVHLFVFNVCTAQTISWNNFKHFPSNLQPIRLANTSSFNASLLTTTGNGVTWDASSLTPDAATPNIILGYYPTSKSAYASTFSYTNYVRLDTNYLTLLEQSFYQIYADSITLAGTYVPSSGKHEVYTNPMKTLVFPLNYGQSVVDDYAKTNYSNATTISSSQTGTNTIAFVGYGTLKLPQGSFNNIAMVSMVRTNSLGPNSLEVSWYDIQTGTALLIYESNNGSTTIGYNTRTTLPTGIDKVLFRNHFEIQNNGSNNITVVNHSTNSEKISLLNHLGAHIGTYEIGSDQSLELLSNTSNGLYFIQFADGSIRKLLKQ